MDFDKTIFGGFSEVEKAYAISQVDPFHDMPYRLEGAPSDASASSVVMIVNQERVITASDFSLPVTEGLKFDMHVVSLPLLCDNDYYPCYMTTVNGFYNGVYSTAPPYVSLFPITVSAAATGQPTFAGGPTVGLGTTVPYFSSNEASGIRVARNMRVIGQSFEIVDETPKFYQQGACTVYNRPSSVNHKNAYCYNIDQGGSSQVRYQFLDSIAAPLNRIQQATIIPTSKTWKSSEGCYVVARRNGSDNPFQRPGINTVVLQAPTDPNNYPLTNSFLSTVAVQCAEDPSSIASQNNSNMIVPYNLTGAYFTGLSNQYGTYRLRAKFIYEILPDPTDSSLIPLASPTIPRNPSFEKLLDDLISSLPYGVPQTMNPKGELWGYIIQKIKDISGKIKKTTEDPRVQQIASFIPGAPQALQTAGKVSNVVHTGAKVAGTFVPTRSNPHQRKSKNKVNTVNGSLMLKKISKQ